MSEQIRSESTDAARVRVRALTVRILSKVKEHGVKEYAQHAVRNDEKPFESLEELQDLRFVVAMLDGEIEGIAEVLSDVEITTMVFELAAISMTEVSQRAAGPVKELVATATGLVDDRHSAGKQVRAWLRKAEPDAIAVMHLSLALLEFGAQIIWAAQTLNSPTSSR